MVEENIYNLIPRPLKEKESRNRYTSNFRDTAKDEYFNNKAPCKTMGPAKVPTHPPDEFLKKHSKEFVLPEKKPFIRETEKRPNVPKSDSQPPLMGIKTTKNFITTNAVENIVSVPKKPAHNAVDTRHGDTFPLPDSGMVPKYVHKKDFGKTPEYIIKRNEEVQRAQEEYDAYIKEHMRRGAMKMLSPDERDEMLNGLKTNWEHTMLQYQCLPVVCDTLFRKNTKEKLEAQIKSLEKDIELFEKHSCIYVN